MRIISEPRDRRVSRLRLVILQMKDNFVHVVIMLTWTHIIILCFSKIDWKQFVINDFMMPDSGMRKNDLLASYFLSRNTSGGRVWHFLVRNFSPEN